MAYSPNKVVTFKDLTGNADTTISESFVQVTHGYPIGYIDSSLWEEPSPKFGNVEYQRGFSCTDAFPYLYKGYAICSSAGYDNYEYRGFLYVPTCHMSSGTYVTMFEVVFPSNPTIPQEFVYIDAIYSFGQMYKYTNGTLPYIGGAIRTARITSTAINPFDDSSAYNLYQVYMLDPSTGEEIESEDYYVEYIE